MYYLDHNATSPLRPESLLAMTHALAVGGNPSSVHAKGRAARAIVEEAREKVAALAGARGEQVIFTSGATEANNLALFGAAEASLEGEDSRITRLFVSSIEHSSVLATANRLVERFPLDTAGAAAGHGGRRDRPGSLACGVARRQRPRPGGGDGRQQ
jgi:cysteine desulfurase